MMLIVNISLVMARLLIKIRGLFFDEIVQIHRKKLHFMIECKKNKNYTEEKSAIVRGIVFLYGIIYIEIRRS